MFGIKQPSVPALTKTSAIEPIVPLAYGASSQKLKVLEEGDKVRRNGSKDHLRQLPALCLSEAHLLGRLQPYIKYKPGMLSFP